MTPPGETMLRHLVFMLLLAGAAPGLAQSASETAQQVGKTAENVVTKPLKDANLIKDEIPPELQAIMAAPYSMKGLTTCKQVSAEIAKLTRVLGPDVDVQKPKSGDSASEIVLGELERTANGLIPGSGIIRKISGAEAQERKAKAAVFAGSLRRAYLKGWAAGKGCRI